MERHEHLTGYLFAVDGQASRRTLLEVGGVQFVGVIRSSGGWEEYTFETPNRLLEEEEWQQAPFTYRLVCRLTGSQLLVLARSKRVVDFLWESELRRLVEFKLRRVFIRIDDLVRLISVSPDRYVLSSVYARVPAFGESLRAVSFYGEDIAEASIFRDHLTLFNCYTCGVRDVVGGTEIVRLGTEGYIHFYYAGRDSVKRVDSVLSFVIENDLMYE